ncbi:helix-turn-helix transcriptional regulator [Muricomes sp. OA1]|jgi:DNA-binding Xre family transcriptional regulator|uniref:helix-turn-helix domain-containing protein n=1 Tax=Lachnospiraceae TaxID=186803 RepID=UPI00047122E2|nr:helix-turn-helix transcriptional regulator [Muricomes sp. OA1]MCH1971656.1 helix-turn-helix transcriptional regulator [Muricomes sp. OA1]MCH1974156.1 helix-turn-helix transcriptional regulator [Muricomes sp. OA1]
MVCAKVQVIIGAMAKSCLTPQEIADKAGVSVNIVYRMRRGYMVKLERFGRVCKALGIDPDTVIDYDRMETGKAAGE